MQAHPSSRFRRRREPSTKATRITHHRRHDGAWRERTNTATAEPAKVHHSSLRLVSDTKSIAAACMSCGFEPPTRARAATELRSLSAVWVSALQTSDSVVHERAAKLRDELHAIANRVGRLLETPGALLPPVRIQAPTAVSGAIPPELRGALIRVAVDRLAELVDRLRRADWRVSGRLGDTSVTIGELVAEPLHSSHRHLACLAATCATIDSAEFGAPDPRTELERVSLVR